MAIAKATDALAAFESARLNSRYWLLIGLLMAHGVVELFDFYLVGFLVSVIGPEWKLTFGQGAIILLSAGVGQIAGALPLANLADKIGRKPLLIGSILLYALAAGALALVPDGNWQLFAALRFLVGVGFGGALTAQITLIVEFSPTRLRTLISNASGAVAPLGILIASILAAFLLATMGWRNLAGLGVVSVVFALVFVFIAPESPRWLISRGRPDKAREIIGRHIDVPEGGLADPIAPNSPEKVRTSELFAFPGRCALVLVMVGAVGLAGFTVQAWGQTIVTLLLSITPAKAAELFIWVSLAGLIGRVAFTIIPNIIGRWRSVLICLWASAAILTAAGLFHDASLGGVSVFFLCLMIGAVFYDGGFTNIAPYCAELFPVRIAAQGAALGNTMNGLTKVAGPALLAMIAGTSNFVRPQATADAVLPAFMTMAVVCVVGAIAVSFLRYETHGKAPVIGAVTQD